MRYHFVVLGDDVADLVSNAGGWIYDRVSAGWEVTVLVPAGTDRRPFRILGATCADLSVTSRIRTLNRHPNAIAMSTDFRTRHEWAGAAVANAMRGEDVEIILWGEHGVTNGDLEQATHRLSVAARAFKAQALKALGESPIGVHRHEMFQVSATRATLSVAGTAG